MAVVATDPIHFVCECVLTHSVDDFEATKEVALFERLGLNLYHGWVVEPQDTESVRRLCLPLLFAHALPDSC